MMRALSCLGLLLLAWAWEPAAAAAPGTACVAEAASTNAARLRQAETLLQAGCNAEALALLEAGSAVEDASSAELRRRLREVRSLVEEERFIEGRREAEEAARQQRALLRCSRLSDLEACEEAIRAAPRSSLGYVATADALLALHRPADALAALRKAQPLEPREPGLAQRIEKAEAERSRLAASCLAQTTQQTLGDCDNALLSGAPDEFALRSRRALRLQLANQPGPALDGYIAAAQLDGDDRAVATAIVSLTDSTKRSDIAALSARGQALLVLKEPLEAIKALRQARALDPRLPRIDAQLARAQEMLAKTAPPSIATPARSRPVAVVPSTPRYSNDAPPNQSR